MPGRRVLLEGGRECVGGRRVTEQKKGKSEKQHDYH